MSCKYVLLSVFMMLAACQASTQNETLFEKGRAAGTNKNNKLEEASGLVASVRNPGYLWTHNDSGNPAHIFLLDSNAVTRKTFKLVDLKNRDWEDITLGPGPEEGIHYLYVGDIGDNLSRYDVKYIYRLKEPALNQDEEITVFDTLIVKLSDKIRDTEAMMMDPVSKNLYLISKREDQVSLYEISYPFTADTLIAQNIGKLPVKSVVGASISPDGREVLIKSYEHIYYYHLSDGQSINDILTMNPTSLAYKLEPQGESIAWAVDASGFYTLSENGKGQRAKLYFYKRK